MQSFDINIPINTTRNIDAQGDYLSYYAGSAGGADATLMLSHDSSGSTIQLKPGQAIRLQKGQSGGLWRLANYANQATIVGSVVIGAGQIDDHTITGSVQVIDGGKNRTMGGSTFCGVGSVGAVAANNAHVQLWNPPGSGKNVFLESFSASSTTAGFIGAVITATQIATPIGNVASKKSGAAASSSAAYKDNRAATLPGAQTWLMQAVASVAQTIKFAEPLAITPGNGMAVYHGTVNTDLTCIFEFYEEGV